jgi:methyl-accepting chemotaxis protein
VADIQAAAVGDWARGFKQAVVEVAPALNTADSVASLGPVARASGSEGAYVGFADKTFHRSKPGSPPPGYDPTSRPWYQRAANASGPVMTPPYLDATLNELVVSFATPVRDGGTLKGVAAMDVSLKTIKADIARIKPSPRSFAMLLMADGTIVAHPNAALAMKPLRDWAPDVQVSALSESAQRNTALNVQVSGDPYAMAVAAVPGTDWLLAVVMSESEAVGAIVKTWSVALVIGLVILVVSSLLLAVFIARRLKQLGDIGQAMREIGEGQGDLSRRLPVRGQDEVADIAQGFNGFVGKLDDIFTEVRSTSDSVRVAAHEIAAGNLDLSQRTEHTAQSLQGVTGQMDGITQGVQESATSAGEADQSARSAAQVAARGGTVVEQVVTTMQDINTSSRKISDIISVINGIAFQTNILALNAAVEAARAGEAGRGFAVVASEVRSLAQRSANAAKEISGLITASVQRVETGTQQVAAAGKTMDEIVASVQQVTAIIGEITTTANRQANSIASVNATVSGLDQLTQQNAALVEESAAAAASLKDQADRLAELMGAFKLSRDGPQPKAPLQLGKS